MISRTRSRSSAASGPGLSWQWASRREATWLRRSGRGTRNGAPARRSRLTGRCSCIRASTARAGIPTRPTRCASSTAARGRGPTRYSRCKRGRRLCLAAPALRRPKPTSSRRPPTTASRAPRRSLTSRHSPPPASRTCTCVRTLETTALLSTAAGRLPASSGSRVPLGCALPRRCHHRRRCRTALSRNLAARTAAAVAPPPPQALPPLPLSRGLRALLRPGRS
mmetsp:Transcript_22681/g.72567  ORF Transcript_22681/g.72567 Transcript_22681/m.72567 type:complete len:223 (+) Transcript_22681:98-766(+)